MCQFFSAIVLRNGDVLHHDATDHHSDLVRHFKLPDDRECRHFAKVEFTPPIKNGVPDYADVNGYLFAIDESTEPQWFAEVRERVEQKCRSIVRAMLITDERDLILDGCWIVLDGAKIREVKGGRFIAVSGGTIQHVWGGTIQNVWGGAIQHVWGGTIQNVRGGTIQHVWGGTIQNVWGGAVPASKQIVCDHRTVSPSD